MDLESDRPALACQPATYNIENKIIHLLESQFPHLYSGQQLLPLPAPERVSGSSHSVRHSVSVQAVVGVIVTIIIKRQCYLYYRHCLLDTPSRFTKPERPADHRTLGHLSGFIHKQHLAHNPLPVSTKSWSHAHLRLGAKATSPLNQRLRLF